MRSITYEQFYEENKDYTTDICKECNSKLELVLKKYEIEIDMRTLIIEDFPQLECQSCGKKFLSEHSKKIVAEGYYELLRRGNTKVISKPRNLNKRYSFCEEINFKYDYRDYDNITGLHALMGDGFLAPVFFNKECLIYFMHHPEYTLSIFSETYGVLGYKDEFEIPFGINTNKKVVFWLGDLDKLDSATQNYLKINNIESDHRIIDSEFYDAQLKVIWSDPIIERQIINLRNKMYDILKQKHSLDLHHLDKEVINEIENINKPITYSDLEVKPVISALHKILIEAVNISNFKNYYENNVGKKDKNYKQWKSIKYYQFILSQYISDEDELRKIIAPLYLLNDLRIIYFHLVSTDEVEKLKNNIVSSLSINRFDETEIMYNKLMEGLKTLFVKFNEVIE